MLNKCKTLFAGLLFVALIGPSFGQVELKIGSVTVPPADLSSASCIQVPVMINDPDMSDRDFRDITFTVEITGDTGIIDGGVATNMLVANGFAPAGAGTGTTGITNPGTDLANNNGTASPSCSAVFNQATQGGAAIDFAGNVNAFANWNINNNQGGVGRKQGFLIDLVGNSQLNGPIAQGSDVLIAVLEIPVIANPGTAQLLITAVPTATVAGGNTYTWDDGVRTNDQGQRVQIVEDFTLPGSDATVNIFDAVDCAGASSTPAEVTWADPQDGGVGGEINFSFPGTALADRINLTGDGLDVDTASAGATTTLSIDTANDGSPTTGGDRSYTATYEVEFPPASGTFVGGVPCTINTVWADASAAPSWDPQPVFGQATTLDVVLTNAVWDGTKYATLTGPNGLSVDLVAPSSGAGTNVLTFNDVHSIGSVAQTDVGTYTVSGGAPDGGTFSADIVLTLEPPVNQTNCNAITQASIEGDVTIPLAGNDGTVDFTVIYNGTTYNNVPEGDFVLSGIVGDATSVTTIANGFDSNGDPDTDEVICDLDYAAATCSASQDPPGTVDVGTVIDLFLDTTNAVDVQIDGVSMTPDVDPDDNFNVQWSATHTAIADTTITATVFNADGETTTCQWTIDINCIDPTIVSVAPVGETGITIYGTFDCVYTVRISEHNTGAVNDYDVLIDTLTNAPLSEGTGTLNVVVPADAWIEVGQLGFPFATDMVPTVPTLGEWGLLAFITLLMGAGVVYTRKRNIG